MDKPQESSVPLVMPDLHVAGIIKLIELSDESFKHLIEAFTQVSASIDPFEVASEVANLLSSQTADINHEDALQISNALISFFFEIDIDDIYFPLPEISFVHSQSNELIAEGKDAAKLGSRLHEFVGKASILTRSKELNKKSSDHEKIFVSSEIYTDIRVVQSRNYINEKSSQEKIFLKLNYLLKVQYLDINARREIFLGMERRDLEDLRDAIDEALETSDIIPGLISSDD